MRRMRYLMAAVALCAAGTLAACGEEDSSSGSGSGGESEDPGSIGVILPDTESSVRWETADLPALEAAFEEAGVEHDVQNAQGDPERMQTIAEQMITEGVSVLAIVNLDSESGKAIQDQAADAGVATIDYDRLTLGGSAEAYVSYDNVQVGELQGQGLADCLGNQPANIVFLNGAPTDNNATLFANGAHSVLDDMDQYDQVDEQAVPDWDNEQAATIFEQMLTQQNGNIDGVLAANDGLGNAAISILGPQQARQVPVTGQDATAQGLQNILAGTQCMTVYKSATQEANALAELAIALLNGEDVETLTNGTVDDGEREVPSVLLEPESITADNVATVVEDGGVSVDELCAGDFADDCEQAGIS